MINFYPGPSKLYEFLQEIFPSLFESSLITFNHRSQPFHELYQKTEALFRKKFRLPYGYHLFFISSATEAWQIVSYAYPSAHYLHIYNGAFGQKWASVSKTVGRHVSEFSFHYNKTLSINKVRKKYRSLQPHVICLTQNETANGTQIKNRTLLKIRRSCKQAIIAVDATSSLGGIELAWKAADIWFASVQKCLGLPAGMAVLIANERAIQQSSDLHYNSLPHQFRNKLKYETTHTPNILNIALLEEVLKRIEPVRRIHQKIKRRAKFFYKWLLQHQFELLISNQHVRSETVIALKDTPENVEFIKKYALENNLIIGNGYGKLQANTYRIANFPAITDREFETLQHCLLQSKQLLKINKLPTG
ncbi:MAG: aminotransferase class V-fold PLP-dependent enzyme [Cytophagales bacterium]|nr:aminotransferase class V-fold PLP-dependent enzyme [Cytophagales bacterium]MDW8384038.1 aminotransferase class V-fold PLP-dependent enzyme [Flammeovirgaceae bacterium]